MMMPGHPGLQSTLQGILDAGGVPFEWCGFYASVEGLTHAGWDVAARVEFSLERQTQRMGFVGKHHQAGASFYAGHLEIDEYTLSSAKHPLGMLDNIVNSIVRNGHGVQIHSLSNSDRVRVPDIQGSVWCRVDSLTPYPDAVMTTMDAGGHLDLTKVFIDAEQISKQEQPKEMPCDVTGMLDLTLATLRSRRRRNRDQHASQAVQEDKMLRAV